jgi:hypothetical protein
MEIGEDGEVILSPIDGVLDEAINSCASETLLRMQTAADSALEHTSKHIGVNYATHVIDKMLMNYFRV